VPSLTLRIVVAALVCFGVATGETQRVPQRIISLVPNVTEILFAIGAGPRVVAVGSFDHFPPEVTKLPRVGALLDPDVERILSLSPDLVVIYASQTDLREQLARAHIDVFSYAHRGLAEVAETMRTLGARTGDAAQGDRVATALERQIAGVRARVAGRPRPKTLLVFGRETDALRMTNVSGSIGFLNDMVEAAGGRNVVIEKRQSVQLSTESLLTLAPDVIIELRYSGELTPAAVEKAAADWQPLASIPAVTNHRVHIVVGDEFVVPGPRIGGATERVARILHPDAFK
jgi:iron complex transport system substrate-binding protein